MSKTIELCSKHIGPVNVLVQGEQRTIRFEDKKGIGWALVDEDEARKLVGIAEASGKGDYWLPGRPPKGEAEVNELGSELPVGLVKAPGLETVADVVVADLTPSDPITVEDAVTVDAPEAKPDEPVPEEEPQTLTERYNAIPNLAALQGLLDSLTSAEDLMALSQLEAHSGRASYMKAINKRLDALQK